ncbi:hypothetical protein PMZ80_005436 [Knufia obscura]|uniref:BTB/POZ domain-containing protein n=1 Tax=Knufia obscura TaxID=1635080 RepID=A0ABR0RQH7_9EURO|nr:hypothetical protein PMZ80_005436 [Knufia obscura]
MVDDDPEAIDMFLLYLYTAELPKMNEVCLRDRLQRAHSAFKLGDKYNVPPLRNLGYAWVYLCIHRVMAVQAPPAAELFDWINGIWGWEIQGASLAKETILNGLVGNFDTIVGLDGFETLVRVNSDFVVDLLRALGEERAE